MRNEYNNTDALHINSDAVISLFFFENVCLFSNYLSSNAFGMVIKNTKENRYVILVWTFNNGQFKQV